MPYKSIEITNASLVYEQPAKTSQFYKGFSSLDQTTSNSKLYDFDLIKQDIINHFNTRKGERLMNPNFGSIIWDLLMEPLTQQVKEALNKDIVDICNYDTRVIPTQISLVEYPSGYIIELTLVIKGTDQSSNMRLAFDQAAGLSIQ
jgi:phage baseplate assembly protein W